MLVNYRRKEWIESTAVGTEYLTPRTFQFSVNRGRQGTTLSQKAGFRLPPIRPRLTVLVEITVNEKTKRPCLTSLAS
jgi:hypothetical protein